MQTEDKATANRKIIATLVVAVALSGYGIYGLISGHIFISSKHNNGTTYDGINATMLAAGLLCCGPGMFLASIADYKNNSALYKLTGRIIGGIGIILFLAGTFYKPDIPLGDPNDLKEAPIPTSPS